MSRTFYDSQGNKVMLSEYGDVENYTHRGYDVYNEFGITNPVEGLKRIYDRLDSEPMKPIFVWLGCGAQYFAMVQKTGPDYGSAIIFGYSTANIVYMKRLDNVWQ